MPITRLALALLLAALSPAVLTAAPRGAEPRVDPRQLSALPSYVQRVEPAIVGLQVEVPRDRPSALTLGAERWGSGVIFDAAGHVLTVSYIVLDAQRIEATLRDGRKVPARLVALDLEVGVGVVKLEGPGPWPVAALGDSTKAAAGDVVGTVGVTDDGRLSARAGGSTRCARSPRRGNTCSTAPSSCRPPTRPSAAPRSSTRRGR